LHIVLFTFSSISEHRHGLLCVDVHSAVVIHTLYFYAHYLIQTAAVCRFTPAAIQYVCWVFTTVVV